LHYLQEIVDGKKTRFERHKKWMGTVVSGDVRKVSGRECWIPLRHYPKTHSSRKCRDERATASHGS